MDYIIYRITAVLKVEVDIARITASPTGRVVIMYLEIFKTCFIVVISEVKLCLMSN